jgi:acetoin utilization protein AcuB
MFVRDCMSSPPVTITPDAPFQDSLKLMHDHRFRRLPVVDEEGNLVGIVSERNLLYAAPAPDASILVWELIYLLSRFSEREIMTQDDITVTTELCAWELAYLLSRLQIGEIMTRDVITTTPDTPIEDAARLMVENKIGGLPVVGEDNRVVGVITETDIFKTFVEYAVDAHKVQPW